MSLTGGDDGGLASPTELARRWRRNLVFAAPAGDPRSRRPIDIIVLAMSSIAVVLLGWAYERGGDLDQRIASLFENPPSWMTSIAVAVFSAAGLYGLVLFVGIGVFGRGRLSVARDMVLAAALALGGVALASFWFGGGFPQMLPEFGEGPYLASYPVGRLAALLAAIGTAGPFLSTPLRHLGRRLVVGAAVAAIVLSYGTLSSVLGGAAIGLAASAAVHLVFGSGQGIPSRARIIANLAEAQVEVTSLEFLAEQPTGATMATAEHVDGRRLLVKVYGRDAADSAFFARLWRAIWYRGVGRGVVASRLQLAEHEALILLILEREGIPVGRLVSGSRASTDDVVVVSELANGVPLALADVELVRSQLDAIWTVFRELHHRRVAHGAVDRRHVLVGEDGPILVELQDAEIAAEQTAIAADRAQLTVATAVTVGIDDALDAARRALSDDELLEVMPLIQAAALPRTLASEVRAANVDLDDVRDGIASRLNVEPPKLAKLHRVTWGSLAMAALTMFAAYSLIGSLTSIGLDTVGDQFSNAAWGWIVLAFLLAQLTNVGEYLTLAGVIGRPVPFGPTMLFRYAISFISLAVPSDAGAIAMSVRYQQKLGVPPAAAIAQGPLLTIVSKLVDLVLLLVTFQFVGRTVELGEVDLGPVVELLKVIGVLVVVGLVVFLSVPSWRQRLVPHIKEGFGAVKGSLTDPQRLGKILAGTLMQKVLFALALSAAVSAFGGSLPFATAIWVNTAVSLFVGLMPVPGGIGVGETALTAGLIIVGVPEEMAFAAAITHRMVTAYIPPVFGWWSSRWLTQRGYL